MGVALLSKYSFVFVLFPMVIAGLTTQDLRARLCTPQISISGVVFVVIIGLPIDIASKTVFGIPSVLDG